MFLPSNCLGIGLWSIKGASLTPAFLTANIQQYCHKKMEMTRLLGLVVGEQVTASKRALCSSGVAPGCRAELRNAFHHCCTVAQPSWIPISSRPVTKDFTKLLSKLSKSARPTHHLGHCTNQTVSNALCGSCLLLNKLGCLLIECYGRCGGSW